MKLPIHKNAKAPDNGAFVIEGYSLAAIPMDTACGLHVEPEMHHITVFNDIFLAFQTPLTRFLGAGLTLELDKVVIGHDFGANKAFFEVGVDDACGLGCGGADADGPGADFFDASGEVGLQVEHFVAGADHAVQARFFEAQGFKEHVFLFAVIELGDFCFDLVADRHQHCAFFFGDGADHVQQRVVLEAVFGDVGDVHDRLGGQQVETTDDGFVVIAHAFHQAAGRLAFAEVCNQLLEQAFLNHCVLVAALGVARDLLQLFFAAVEVGEDQFKVDDLDVAFWVDAVGNVNYVLVFEAAHYVGDGIGLADIGEKLVAQAFAFRGACHEAGDVDELHGGWQDTFRVDDGRQGSQTRVRHRHDAGVRLDGAEGEVLGCNTGFGQGVEQGGLADVRQADDAAIESHGVSPRVMSGLLAVQVFHRPVPFTGEDIRQHAEGKVDTGVQFFLFGAWRSTQDKAGYLAGIAWVANAKPQAMKCVLVAELRDDVAQTVMTAMTAAHFEFGNARRQVQFVVRHQNRLDRDTVEARKRRDSLAAAVHVGGGDQQTNILTLMRKASGQAKEFALGNEIGSLRRSNTLNEKSPCVMPGLFVFSAWISQAHDQLYGGHDRGSSFGVVG
ncbi:hypothetical protein ALQ28_05001 [Pseudomonas syringae pv. delphinii]|uniref:Uncharacterized protein n=1 Tax=Pseudomonas syringae pv. delphinii TaxID=192088 RepID=A0A0P9ULB2_9PSED|nr:Uncharacterized protein ALO72_05010 [Pseudomonas syringae pv. delphinii]RMP10768.1 hypothetical protein ALQ28_05001 [Pseudomonas syringae pv. delphinii]